MTTQEGDTMQGNKRLPGDLLGRWQRLNAELEAKAEDLHYGGILVDWSDVAVLNAFLTEDAEFAKWMGDADSEPKIMRVNFDALQGNTEIWATMPNVAMLAAECTELLKANDAKNYVQFDMIPRAESGVQGYRVTVQRLYGKSPAQRVIEMEKEVGVLRATLATQATETQESYKSGWEMGYEKGKQHDFVLINSLEATIATQAERIDGLELMVERARKWLPNGELDGGYDDE